MGYVVNRNFLLLLTVGVVINTRGQGTLNKPTVPAMVTACLGSNATISCTISTDIKGHKFKWYFSNTSTSNVREKIEFDSSHYHEAKGKTASYLIIRNVSVRDEGWYFCEVTQDVPRLIINNSDGSHLVIDSATESPLKYNTTNSTTVCDSPTESPLEDNTTNSTTARVSVSQNASPWWLWVAVAAGCALLIAPAIIATIICRRKKEAPVYENTKEASKRHWKEDQSLHQCMPGKGYSNEQADTLKPHKYESYPKGRQPSPKYR